MANPSATDKRPWDKPQLTVMVRNTPEEAVLYGCKFSNAGMPNNTWNSCNDKVGTFCGSCNALNAS